MPYPDGLLLALGMTGPFSEDQIDGLYYVVRELSLREKEIIRMRYVEHMTYHAIADTCGLTCSRIRQITVKALHKLGRASAACYYTDGYRYTQDRIRKEEEHKARLLQERAQAIAKMKDGEISTDIYICDMGFSTRATNCLV